MSRIIGYCLAALLLATVLSAPADAIERVSRKLNFIEINGAYLAPVGTIDGVVAVPLDLFPQGAEPFGLDASNVYKGSYSLGLAIGQLHAGRFLWSLGFRYSHHQLKDTIDLPLGYIWIPDPDLSLNQYDVEMNLNYYFLDISRNTFAPYVGLGVAGGILSGSYNHQNFSESKTKALAAVNFGFDLRLWQSQDGRDLVALVSENRYDILATRERPKYLTVGAALRFYIRP